MNLRSRMRLNSIPTPRRGSVLPNRHLIASNIQVRQEAKSAGMQASKARVILPAPSLRPLTAHQLRNSRLGCRAYRVDICPPSAGPFLPYSPSARLDPFSVRLAACRPVGRAVVGFCLLQVGCWLFFSCCRRHYPRLPGCHVQHQILPETNPDLAPSGIFVAAKPLPLEPKYRQLCHVIEPSASARLPSTHNVPLTNT